jgi:predicted RNase H-like HicB family nuclease
MKMRYPAIVTREGKNLLAEFPTCQGCQTFAPPGRAIAHEAVEALAGWLEAHLQEGMLPPKPPRTVKLRRGQQLLWVAVDPKLAAKLELRWTRAPLRRRPV